LRRSVSTQVSKFSVVATFIRIKVKVGHSRVKFQRQGQGADKFFIRFFQLKVAFLADKNLSAFFEKSRFCG
jgi:hypothetical protein